MFNFKTNKIKNKMKEKNQPIITAILTYGIITMFTVELNPLQWGVIAKAIFATVIIACYADYYNIKGE